MMRHVTRVARLSQPSDLASRRQILAIASNEDPGRDALIVRTVGIDTSAFETNPIILFDHSYEHPIARAERVWKDGTALRVLIQFPPAGVSRESDEKLGLIQAGTLSALSLGFDPIETRAIERDGERLTEIVKSELLEISIVAVPALASALVTERAYRGPRYRSSTRRSALHHADRAGRYERDLEMAVRGHRYAMTEAHRAEDRALPSLTARECYEQRQRLARELQQR